MPNAPCSYGHSRLFPVSPFFAHKENPPSVLHALARGGVDAVVIAAHGRPMPGFGSHLEPGSDVILTPAEMFASTPPIVGPLACLGCQVPGQSSGDRLTLATIALTSGSRQILVT
jgi:hypothetical protein